MRAQPRYQEAVGQFSLGKRLGIEHDAAFDHLGASGQHHSGADGLVGDRGRQAQAHHPTLHLQLLVQAAGHRLEPEIGAPQGAAAQVDELRKIAPAGAAVLLAGLQLKAGGQTGFVELHHMGARPQVVGMPAAFAVGHDVGAVLQHDAHALEAQWLAGAASFFAVQVVFWGLARLHLRDAADQNGAAAIQVLTHQHAGARHIGSRAADGLRRVFSLADLGA